MWSLWRIKLQWDKHFSEYYGYLDNVISTMLQNRSSTYQRCHIIEAISVVNHEVVLKGSGNWNTGRKPLLVQLCAARYRELYPLWINLPSGVLLWRSMCFFCLSLWRRVSAVLRSYRPVKWLMWMSTGFASNSASNSARRQGKHA